MNSALKWFHKVGYWEGISYLILLFIAMPLKYWAGIKMAVSIAGMIHGALFVAFMWTILQVWLEKVLTFKQCILAFLLSLVPFGTFYLHRIYDHKNLKN